MLLFFQKIENTDNDYVDFPIYFSGKFKAIIFSIINMVVIAVQFIGLDKFNEWSYSLSCLILFYFFIDFLYFLCKIIINSFVFHKKSGSIIEYFDTVNTLKSLLYIPTVLLMLLFLFYAHYFHYFHFSNLPFTIYFSLFIVKFFAFQIYWAIYHIIKIYKKNKITQESSMEEDYE